MHKAVNFLIYGCKGEQWSVLLHLYSVRNLMKTVYQSNNRTPYNKMICTIKTINTTTGIFMQFKTTGILQKKMIRDLTKPTKWVCAQRRLRSAWASAQSDQSSLSAWRKLESLAIHWAHCEDSDQTGRMPRLMWVFAGRTVILLVLSCRGSNAFLTKKKSWMTWNLERIVLNWDLSTSDTRTYAPENQV